MFSATFIGVALNHICVSQQRVDIARLLKHAECIALIQPLNKFPTNFLCEDILTEEQDKKILEKLK